MASDGIHVMPLAAVPAAWLDVWNWLDVWKDALGRMNSVVDQSPWIGWLANQGFRRLMWWFLFVFSEPISKARLQKDRVAWVGALEGTDECSTTLDSWMVCQDP